MLSGNRIYYYSETLTGPHKTFDWAAGWT